MVALRWRHRRHRLITWLLFMQWNSQLGGESSLEFTIVAYS